MGEQLRIARMELGLSQAELGRRSGISRKHIADAEKGSNITIAVLRRLARALGITNLRLGDFEVTMVGADQEMLNMAADKVEHAAEEVAAALAAAAAFLRSRTD